MLAALPPSPPAVVIVVTDSASVQQRNAEAEIPGPAALTGFDAAPQARPAHCIPS